MRSNLIYSIPACLALLAVACLRAEDQSPQPGAEPISRYQAMIERSPFALATETAPPIPAPENAGFTKDLVLTGAVRLNGGRYITVESKDHNQRFSLKNGESYNEISLVSVAWSDAAGKTKATLKKGSEFGIIGFDDAAARAGANAPQAGNESPGVPQGQPQGNALTNAHPPQPSVAVSSFPAQGQRPGAPVVRRTRPIPAGPR
ncbi:MAG: hypothetical protein ACFUZC_15200 [Chthoniobacteraceae bacterium]